MATETYVYTKLATNPREIRLLKAVLDTSTESPWESVDQVKFDIQIHSLDKLPPYFALSYTWGDPTCFTQIQCNGKRTSVTKNLARALHTVISTIHSRKGAIWEKRYTLGDDIYIWADGLCINQTDFAEKNTQIPLMTDIYRKARDVVGYIGAPQHTDPVEAFQAMFFQNNAALYSFNAHDAADADWKELWSQPWFGRSWVIQEVILGTVMCVYGNGTNSCSWPLSLYQRDELWYHVMDLFPRDGDWSIGFNMRQTYTWNQAGLLWAMSGNLLGMVRHMLGSQAFESAEKAPNEMDFLHALCYARPAQATDSRDKVYSILGLLSEADRQSVKVDYSPLYTTAQLYLDTALHFIRSGQGARLLEHAGTSRSIEGLPTWAPDWSFESRYPLSTFYYAAARSSQPSISLHPQDPSKLIARGVIVDAISITGWRSNYLKGGMIQELAVQDPRTHLLLLEANAKNICMAIRAMTENKEKYYTGEKYEEVIWRTMTADIGNNTQRAVWEDKECYRAWAELIDILRARTLDEFYAPADERRSEQEGQDIDRDADANFESTIGESDQHGEEPLQGDQEGIKHDDDENDRDATILTPAIKTVTINAEPEPALRPVEDLAEDAQSGSEGRDVTNTEASGVAPAPAEAEAEAASLAASPHHPVGYEDNDAEDNDAEDNDAEDNDAEDSIPPILPLLAQPSNRTERELEHKGKAFEIKARRLLFGRMLVGTDGGLLGAVPNDTEGRDLIVCIAGANVPFVLRPVRDDAGVESPGEYLLVGACYVHGLMDGLIPSSMHTTDFILR